jgi:hypothetical protein
MRAIVLEKFDGLDSLVYEEIPDPEPKAVAPRAGDIRGRPGGHGDEGGGGRGREGTRRSLMSTTLMADGLL